MDPLLTWSVTETKDALLPPATSEEGRVVNSPSDSDHRQSQKVFDYFRCDTGNVARSQAATELLEDCRSFDRTIGHVFASSGLRLCRDGYPQD